MPPGETRDGMVVDRGGKGADPWHGSGPVRVHPHTPSRVASPSVIEASIGGAGAAPRSSSASSLWLSMGEYEISISSRLTLARISSNSGDSWISDMLVNAILCANGELYRFNKDSRYGSPSTFDQQIAVFFGGIGEKTCERSDLCAGACLNT